MLSIPSHVHWARVEGGTAVLDLHTGQWHLFTGTGARVWDTIAQHDGVEGLSAQLALPADGSPTADRDVADYVCRLRTMGLLTPTENPPSRARRWWRR
ncbi:PqqD family protein [Streptomyces sp. NPDC020667]|uniref:PqqD family protein n=1 Tax=Streptomyces sp. NPDC020667 TaxID=3154895 RepID=UPI0033FCDB3E